MKKVCISIFLTALTLLYLTACHAELPQIEGPQESQESLLQNTMQATTQVASRNSATGQKVVIEDWQTVVAEAPLELVVHVDTENIIIQQGTEFKIEVDAGSESSYVIRDNRGVSYSDRYYYYAHWELIFEYKDKQASASTYSDSVIITIPESTAIQYFSLRAGSGNIYIEDVHNINLSMETRGNIHLENVGTEAIDIYRADAVELLNITATDDILIRGESYYGGKYMTGPDGQHTIIIDKLSLY